MTTAIPGQELTARNHFGFGVGTFGRDAAYTMVSLYLIFYLTDVLHVSSAVLLSTTAIIVVVRVLDAILDPFIGVLVDNTQTKWGKFKPWILGGGFASALLMVLLFTDFRLSSWQFLTVFFLVYTLYSIAYTANDVAYWSTLPALSQSQRQREKIGSFARICASLGAFTMVVAIVPITHALGGVTGSLQGAYQLLAFITVAIMVLFQVVMVVAVKEDESIPVSTHRTRFRDLLTVIFKNDQLVWVAICMALFSVAYGATVSLGIYYFKYVFGDENMYPIFAAVLGVAQIGTLAAYPALAKRLNRTQLYTLATVLVTAGYVIFFFAPTGNMIVIGIAGLSLFIGQALIQMLVLMFIADTVEYGQWKLGRRNESVTLSIQPFINKLGGALASGVVGITVVLSHIQDVPEGGVLHGSDVTVFKFWMLVLPLAMIVASYFIYRAKYRINESFYTKIVAEIRQRESRTGDPSNA